MKTLLSLMAFVACMLIASTTVQAQLYRTYTTVKDSSVNTDNTSVSFGAVTSDVIGFIFEATKVSGTVNGTAQLQGSRDGVKWSPVDTAYVITDESAIQYGLPVDKLIWAQYRWYITTGGTCKINAIKAYTVRRTAR